MARYDKIIKRLTQRSQPLRMRHDYGFRAEEPEFNIGRIENYIDKLNQRAKIVLRNVMGFEREIKKVQDRKYRVHVEKYERYDKDIEKWKILKKEALKDYNEIVQMLNVEIEDLAKKLDETEDRKMKRDIQRVLAKGQKYIDYHNEYLEMLNE